MIYTEKTALKLLMDNGLPQFLTGSRVICNPPVLDTDIDFVVLDLENFDFASKGWIETTGDKEEYGEQVNFRTFRSGDVNLIVVWTRTEFFKWRVATAAAKQMNLLNKKNRIDLFQGVLYGNWGEE